MAIQRPSREGKRQIGVYVEAELFDRVQQYIRKERRTLTSAVEIALEDLLKKNGE